MADDKGDKPEEKPEEKPAEPKKEEKKDPPVVTPAEQATWNQARGIE